VDSNDFLFLLALHTISRAIVMIVNNDIKNFTNQTLQLLSLWALYEQYFRGPCQRVYAQTIILKKTWLSAFSNAVLCKLANFVGILALSWFSCSLVFFPHCWIRFGGFWVLYMYGEKGGGGLCLSFICLLFRRCSIQFQLYFLFLSYLHEEAKATSTCRLNFKSSSPPFLFLFHACVFVIFVIFQM
jgi:hypothetical protein